MFPHLFAILWVDAPDPHVGLGLKSGIGRVCIVFFFLGHVRLDGVDEFAGDVVHKSAWLSGPQYLPAFGIDFQDNHAGFLTDIDLVGMFEAFRTGRGRIHMM